ncbi:MAG: putative baseplate assembly protein [Anaerolineaceae bacterium]|nr:putative baseplate assembly protein [Anaerolineaceae bacterium]
MPLPEPKLDDRTFQDLVNEAKGLIPHYTPEWTDHNLSDPGVTMIELFAWMVDILLYRINRVPEKNYIRFMDLLGIRLQGATPARVPVAFWLSAPQPGSVMLAKSIEVATVRTGDQPAISFTTDSGLTLYPPTLKYVITSSDEKNFTDQSGKVELPNEYFEAFQHKPGPGDALYLGFTENLSQHTLSLNINCQVQGIGVDPRDPPLAWQAWCGEQNKWVRVDVEVDNTGGFNQAGTVVIYLPAGMQTNTYGKLSGYWVRVIIVPNRVNQPTYSASPNIQTIKATTIGGTIWATHATLIKNEILGRGNGTPGQTFKLENTPVLARLEDENLEGQNEVGDWIPYKEVDSFAPYGPQDQVYMLDSVSGIIQFGPSILQPDGSERQYGHFPSKGQSIRFSRYRFGGGITGNVGAKTITVLKSSIPYIARVNNRIGASGGLDPENIEAAKMRVPMVLRAHNRAVTASDFEYLAKEASPAVGRARCIQAGAEGTREGASPGSVEVLIVPALPVGERITVKNLQPAPAVIEEVRKYLDERRLLTTNVIIDSPIYVGIAVEADVTIQRNANAERVKTQVIERLFHYTDPLVGGPDGTGWPFGRDLYLSEVLTLIQSVSGVEYVQNATLFEIDLQSGQARAAGQKVDLTPDSLIYSYSHKINVKNQS